MGVRWGTLAAARSGSKYLLSAGRVRRVKRMHAPGGRLRVKFPKLSRVKLKAVFLRGLGTKLEVDLSLEGNRRSLGFTSNDKQRRVECCGIPLKPKDGLEPDYPASLC